MVIAGPGVIEDGQTVEVVPAGEEQPADRQRMKDEMLKPAPAVSDEDLPASAYMRGEQPEGENDPMPAGYGPEYEAWLDRHPEHDEMGQ